MARPSTVARVHSAVLELVTQHGPSALTMEGIAVKAGVGKQTLYRTWSSVPAILFDALLARSASTPDHPPSDEHVDLPERLERMLRAAIDEISTEPNATLLRTLAAAIQTDDVMARAYRDRLLDPQLAAFHTLLRDAGASRPERTTELLLAPVFYRWFMRMPPLHGEELTRRVRDVLDLDR